MSTITDNMRKSLQLELQSLAQLCSKEADAIIQERGFVALHDIERQVGRIDQMMADLELEQFSELPPIE